MIAAFFYGLLLSFGLIVPLGMQNVFIFNQGATQKRIKHLLPCVLTAALCDALLILLAVLGVSLIVLKVPTLEFVFCIIGFLFLSYMGWSIWRSSSTPAALPPPLTPKKQILFCLSVSLLNPHAIIDSIGVIGANSLNFTGAAKYSYTSACILVSFLWFFSLAILGHFMGKSAQGTQWIKRINKISALIIWGVAFILAKQLLLG